MILELPSETWKTIRIEKPGVNFYKSAAAVTLPNGDCLITGGEYFNGAVY